MQNKKPTKPEKLKLQLADSLHEEVTLNCHHHGPQTFTIGEFLENQVACSKCKSDLPVWHKDQLVYPVMNALIKLAAEEERAKNCLLYTSDAADE